MPGQDAALPENVAPSNLKPGDRKELKEEFKIKGDDLLEGGEGGRDMADSYSGGGGSIWN